MEAKECICPQAGFCELFRQEMTYDPPNWQWCQNATPEDREWYVRQCEKKKDRKEQERRFFLAGEYITTSRMIKDCKDLLLPQVANLNLKGVLGIPRSGMLPASVLAMWLNLPLYGIDSSGKVGILSAATEFGGIRMKSYTNNKDALLVVDDTIYAGTAIDDMKKKIDGEAFYAVVYAKPSARYKADFFGRQLPPPHLLEWNLFNCTYIEHALLDFDGIFSPNVPYEACQDENKYIDYIKNVKPFYHRIPKTFCKGIVTARLEKYRDITEEWLKKHGINYGFLKMYPTEDEQKRNNNHVEEASTFKANAFIDSSAKFFIESEIAEAILIRQKSGKFVICPQEDE